MKKVNFKNLEVEVEISKFETMDLRKQLGNAIHREAMTVPMSELAKRIYYSEDYIEIDEEDYNSMVEILSRLFKRFVIEAIEVSSRKA